eukprot:UN23595
MKFQAFQRVAYKYFKENLQDVALANIKSLDSRETLFKHLEVLTDEELKFFMTKIRILDENNNAFKINRELMLEIVCEAHLSRPSRREEVNALPMYPTEKILWDKNIVPSERYDRNSCLALPKLNLQFLTIYDYLQRNFTLFRLESTYEIREDLAKYVWRIRPRLKNVEKKDGAKNPY